MDAALSIASSALSAATTEIAVTAENVANAQTTGYVDQQAQLASQPGNSLGVGDGVAISSIAQMSDPLLAANNLQAQGALSSLSAQQQVLTGIENIFPLGQSSSNGTPTNTSIAGQLASFWAAWDGINQDPSGAAPRTQVIDAAQGLVSSLHGAAGQMSQLANNTQAQVTTQIGEVNTLLRQAATLNQQIVAVKGGGGTPNQLLDQMNQITNELASLAGATVQMQQNGSAQISIGNIAMVQNGTAWQLTSSPSSGTVSTPSGNVTATQLSLQATFPGGAANPIALNVSSGSLAGLLTGYNQSIPVATAELNQVATNLGTLVNNQLKAGYTYTPASAGPPATAASTSPGTALFSVPSGSGIVGGAAWGISMNFTNPNEIAAASTANPAAAANDGSNAATIAEFANTTGYTTSPDTAYQQLIQNIGSQTQTANSQVASQTAVAQQAQQAFQAATGVNTNTELTNLIQFQSSYQASAKLVSIVDSTIQSLLQAV
jgi:flagellar hook-associated protein 1 FlgK